MKINLDLTSIRCLDVVHIFLKTQSVNANFVQESRIAEIVGHHNGRIQRAKIECSDRNVVIAFLGFNDSSSLILLIRSWKMSIGNYTNNGKNVLYPLPS